MYRWVEHTAELELEIDSGSEQDVFADAVAAFAELLGDGNGETVSHEIYLQATERGSQLVELLEELVFLADTSGFVPEHLAEIDLTSKRALVEGRDGSPPPLVKAVTYHGLEFHPDEGRWRARVVLDV